MKFAYAACVLAVVTALGAPSLARAETGPLTVDLHALNASGETGTAALTEVDGGVEIVITLANAPASAQPAHVHRGTCDNGTSVAYPLTNVIGGNSTTIVKGVTIEQLLASPMSINVHKSTADLATYVACGDIKAS